jgi:hypothetical protein
MKGTSKQPIVYRGQDTVEKFVECMVQEQEDIEQKFKHCEPMLMTGSEWHHMCLVVFAVCDFSGSFSHPSIGTSRLSKSAYITYGNFNCFRISL